MPVKAGYLFLTAGGIVFVWSGLRGKSVSSVFRQLAGGDSPANAANANSIAGVSSSSSSSSSAGASYGYGGGSNATVPASASQTAWNRALLAAIGAPATQANLSSLADWQAHEEPESDWSHWNNPMNTTLGTNGSVSENSDNVQSYPSLSAGLQATIDTLTDGSYQDILSQLRAGKGLTSGASQGLLLWSQGSYSSV